MSRNAAAPLPRAAKEVVDALFTWGATRLEVRLQTLVRKPRDEGGSGIDKPEDNRIIEEGLSGESILDWINPWDAEHLVRGRSLDPSPAEVRT